MRGYDPAKAIGTVKERCVESKKDAYGVRQCILNKDHAGSHLHAVHRDVKVIAKVNKLVESKIKAEMRKG